MDSKTSATTTATTSQINKEKTELETSQAKTSFQYVETIHDAKVRTGTKDTFPQKIADCFEKLYWIYYIHLPFYLMTSFDSFCLHVFFLMIFSLSLFGIIKYIFL
ncbi:hypothetical protein TBLA_0I01920 [Henningerozyma blattae CBS 6284]|uniref:Uncharacterized protein n=1 Tax=Henningerozyma blattae (strain ATCC 34711 / CBS 6284 / DSM 70876 / NBRC 10599 / NRRL Y-10934 / UCD 77-7) TaxID=1071380 RepID=I2H8Z9_HENB6|nr:hypothetical protein TBLA_0I01920 [Tetrapisispora blattae CBS 6284]CCH62851.1 hypothetical protein TBLA_0I01920 [Tetrapisispora blattae CBS 6284]